MPTHLLKLPAVGHCRNHADELLFVALKYAIDVPRLKVSKYSIINTLKTKILTSFFDRSTSRSWQS